ncbi:MAG: Mur ligase family protein [Endomicrobiaceae bacterium]|nr:Mur ligase family protein [Endomicrobiaceae bacterium]
MIFQQVNEYKSMKPGLERIENFLFESRVEYKKIKYIHIAGTNGKGSTAKILSECLTASGYKTGLYISPHIVKINERIQIDSANISDKDLKKIYKKYEKLAKKCKLTFFEHITALAFIYFTQQKVDIVILETGLGGRFDATNVITPLLSIITSVDFDHTEILGSSLSKIAFEKAGIIKDNTPVICGVMPKVALSKISSVAKQKKSEVYLFGKDFSALNLAYNWKIFYQRIKYKGINTKINFNLNLLGNSQIYNSAMVLCACELLKQKSYNIKFGKLKNVFSRIKWDARFDIRDIKVNSKNIKLLIDGAHNLQAISNFLELYKRSPFSKEKRKLIFAVMQEKDYKSIIKKISKIAGEVCLVNTNNQRAVSNKILEREFLKYIDRERILKFESIKECFKSFENNDVVVVVGSFYLAGSILRFIEDKNG